MKKIWFIRRLFSCKVEQLGVVRILKVKSYQILKMGFCFASTSVGDNCLHEKRVIVLFEPNWQPNSPNAGLSNVLKHVFHATGRDFVEVLVQQIRGS